MKQNTPIQQAIEKLKKEIEEVRIWRKSTNFKDKRLANILHDSCIKAYEKSIKNLQNHLPKEQAAIEDAYKEGCIYYSSAFPKSHYNIDAEFYFTNRYKSNE